MSKRSPRTTKRERRARAAVERGDVAVYRDRAGRRVLVVRDEATAFERHIAVDADPDLAGLVDELEAEGRTLVSASSGSPVD
jgi:hypothetical protein